MKATIKAADLRAAITNVSKDESRRILCGVHVKVEGGTCKVTATDSYRLVRTETELEGEHEDGEVTLDLSVVKIPTKKGGFVNIEHKDGESKASVFFFANHQTLGIDVIEGTYPNTEQLLPFRGKDSETNDYAEPVTAYAFSPKYMSDMGKAAQIWAENAKMPMSIEFRGEMKPCYMAKVDGKRRFEAIVMPCRGFDKNLKQPVKGSSSELKERVKKLEAELDVTKKAHKDMVESYQRAADRVRELEASKEHPNQETEQEPVQEPAQERPKTGYEELDSILAKFEGVKVSDDTKSCVWLTGVKKGTKAAEELKAIGVRKAQKGKHAKQWYFSKPRA